MRYVRFENGGKLVEIEGVLAVEVEAVVDGGFCEAMEVVLVDCSSRKSVEEKRNRSGLLDSDIDRRKNEHGRENVQDNV